jgi:branched-chain amino acid transport system permease protein
MSAPLAVSGTESLQILVDSVALGAVYALMAVGIGLVFGVLRLVNFAYGQLIMAGAYALALTNGYSPVVSILVCFGVVLALSAAMEVAVFRPLRTATPATMLVATFAISFLLQSIAQVLPERWGFGSLGRIVATLPRLNRPVSADSQVLIRWIWIVAIVVAGVALAALALFLARTSIGLQMRAAAADFRTARLLGVRANGVIAFAVLLSGLLAATVSVIMSVEQPLVTPDYALRDTILVLVGVVVGGIDRLLSATLGGFAVGFAVEALGGFLPSTGEWPFTSSLYRDSALFALVILVLLLRPAGLFARRGQGAAERV